MIYTLSDYNKNIFVPVVITNISFTSNNNWLKYNINCVAVHSKSVICHALFGSFSRKVHLNGVIRVLSLKVLACHACKEGKGKKCI